MLIAWCTEIVHGLLSSIISFEPFLTRAEVVKVGVSHYMSIADATADLNYTPLIPADQAIARASAYFSPLVTYRPFATNKNHYLFLLFISGFLSIVFLFWLFFLN